MNSTSFFEDDLSSSLKLINRGVLVKKTVWGLQNINKDDYCDIEEFDQQLNNLNTKK